MLDSLVKWKKILAELMAIKVELKKNWAERSLLSLRAF